MSYLTVSKLAFLAAAKIGVSPLVVFAPLWMFCMYGCLIPTHARHSYPTLAPLRWRYLTISIESESMAAAENRGVHPLYAATSAVAPFVVRTDHLTREKDNFRWALPSRGDTSPCPSVPKTQPCKWESDQSYLRMRWQGDKSECYSNNYCTTPSIYRTR